MRTCVCGRGGGAARLAASVVGCVLCMCGAARHPCVEDMQRGVVAWCGCEFARLLFCLLQHIKHDLYRIVTHSCHLADALTLSDTDSAARGLQAARQLRSNSHSFRRKMRCAGRIVMRATVCGHHVRQRNDEKLADLRSETLIMWDKSPSPPRSVKSVQRLHDLRE